MMTLMISSIVTAAAVESMEINTAADGLLLSFEVHRVYCLWRVRASMVETRYLIRATVVKFGQLIGNDMRV